MTTIICTTISGRPDLYSLQIQLMKRFIAGSGIMYAAIYCPPRRPWVNQKDADAYVAETCRRHGVALMRMPASNDKNALRRAAVRAVAAADMAMIIEDDVLPIAPIELGRATFARTASGVPTYQLRYFRTGDPDGIEIGMESYRHGSEAMIPPQCRGLGFDPNLCAEVEWYGGWMHYDKGSARTFRHEVEAKDRFANAVAAAMGAEPFSRSFANVMDLSQHHTATLGAEATTMTTGQIAVAMRTAPPPGLAQMLANVTGSTAKAAAALLAGGKAFVGTDQYRARLAECNDCTNRSASGTACSLCGCSLRAKARIATEACPIGRWKSHAMGQEPAATIEERSDPAT